VQKSLITELLIFLLFHFRNLLLKKVFPVPGGPYSIIFPFLVRFLSICRKNFSSSSVNTSTRGFTLGSIVVATGLSTLSFLSTLPSPIIS
jgi:hypothetical protein